MPKYQYGLTLVELLITLSLLAIFASIALPSFTALIHDNRDSVLREQLTSYLHAARHQAVLQRQSYRVCGSSDGNACTGDWDKHWLLLSSDGSILQRNTLPPKHALCWQGFSSAIKFHSNGTSPSSNGRFALCREQKMVWALTLNRQGRLRNSSQDSPANCCATNHPST